MLRSNHFVQICKKEPKLGLSILFSIVCGSSRFTNGKEKHILIIFVWSRNQEYIHITVYNFASKPQIKKLYFKLIVIFDFFSFK